MKKSYVILLFAAVSAVGAASGQVFPVRYWSDDMPQHTFLLGAGPSWIAGRSPLAESYDLDLDGSSPIGVNLALRYDWSYFRGYEVAMGTGLTCVFIRNSRSFRDRSSFASGGRLSEQFGYIGVNAVDTKMWFGKRLIGDVSIHMGYLWGASVMKMDETDVKTKVGQNGFAGGVSVGLDCLITAWLGVGLHLDVLAGTPRYGSSERDFTECAARIAAVYCF